MQQSVVQNISPLIDGSASPTPDLSVILVSWNTCALLTQCLDSLLGTANGLQCEIFVVDNASTDGSVEQVRRRFPHVHVIGNSENMGFAHANNQALRLAQGRYVLLLNPDTIVQAGAIERMVSFLDQHAEVGACGPKLTLLNGRAQGGAAGYLPTPFTVLNYNLFLYRFPPYLLRGHWLSRAQYRGGNPIAVDWISGAALMVRSTAVDQIGLLNEDYFMYVEDVEWCERLRRNGWQVYCLPDAHIVHLVGRSSRQRGAAFVASSVSSRDHYYRERFSTLTVRTLHLIGVLGALIRWLGYLLLYLLSSKRVYQELGEQWQACCRASLQYAMAGQAQKRNLGQEKAMNLALAGGRGRRIARNTLAMAAMNGVRILLGFGINVYIARTRDEIWLGQWAILLAFINIFMIISEFGLPRLVTREVARERGQASRYFYAALSGQLVWALLSMAIMVAITFALGYSPDTTQMLLVATLTLPSWALFSASGALLQAYEKMEWLAYAEGISSIVQFAAVVVLLQAGFGVVSLALIKVGGVLLSAGILYYGLSRQGPLGRPRFDISMARKLVGQSTDIFLIAIFGAVLFRIDTLVLSKLQGEAAVGIYNAASTIVRTASLMILAYTDAIYPPLSQLAAEVRSGQAAALKAFNDTIRRSLTWGTAATALVAVVMAVMSGLLIRLIFHRPEYSAAAPAMRLLCLSLLPYYAYSIVSRALLAADEQRAARNVSGWMIVIALLALAGLTAVWDIQGTALAMSLVFAVGAVWNWQDLKHWAQRALAEPAKPQATMVQPVVAPGEVP